MVDRYSNQDANGNPDELITLSEAALISGLKQASLQVYAANGRLKARKLGSIWVTTRTNLHEYLTSRHQGKKL